MKRPKTFADTQALAEAAAEEAVTILRSAIETHDVAVWVLAGGTAPMLAYKIIAEKYLSAINWSKVTFVIGDERIGPADGPDNNWHIIEQTFLHLIPRATFLRPKSDQPAEQAADDYQKQLLTLPSTKSKLPRLDLVWLGMGEDGHTLSLFPDHPDFIPTTRLVVAVHNSPKPPADRISLTIHALAGAEHTMVLTSGSGKADAVKAATDPTSNLPIAQAVAATHAEWFIDTAAGSAL